MYSFTSYLDNTTHTYTHTHTRMSTTSSETKNLDNLNPEQIFVAFSNLTSQNVEPNSEPILEHYSAMNKKLGISHLSGFNYYRKLQEHIDNNLRAKALWEILNKKAGHVSDRLTTLSLSFD